MRAKDVVRLLKVASVVLGQLGPILQQVRELIRARRRKTDRA